MNEGVVKNFIRGIVLKNPPAVHDNNFIGDDERFFLVVGHIKGADADLLISFLS
jgi:hypothetical protein